MNFPLLSAGRRNNVHLCSPSDGLLDLTHCSSSKEKSLPQTPLDHDTASLDDTSKKNSRATAWPTQPQSLARPWFEICSIRTFDILLALLPLIFIVLACIAAFLNGRLIYVDGQVGNPIRQYGQNVAMFTSKYVLFSISLGLDGSN